VWFGAKNAMAPVKNQHRNLHMMATCADGQVTECSGCSGSDNVQTPNVQGTPVLPYHDRRLYPVIKSSASYGVYGVSTGPFGKRRLRLGEASVTIVALREGAWIFHLGSRPCYSQLPVGQYERQRQKRLQSTKSRQEEWECKAR
jgi:hypothetical protein